MLEGKALFVAVMMLTAAPIAVTDEGQAFLGDITYDLGEMLDTDKEENNEIDKTLDLEDKDLLLTDENLVIDCLTLEQWKEEFYPEEKIGDERKESKENDKARGNDDSKETDEKKDDSDVRDWADKETVAKDGDCLTPEEWVLKFESNEEEPCFTLEDLEKKMRDGKEDWNKDWHNDGERDWDEEWFEELEILAEACKDGNEEACEELLVIREELVEDREEEERDEDDGGARGDNDDSDEEDDGEHNHADDKADDHSHDDDEADDHNHVTDHYDENWEEIRAVIQELAEACEDGNEEACVELREMIAEMLNDRKEAWNKDWHNDGERDWNEDSCLTMEEWKKIFAADKREKDERDREDDRKERGPHRDAFVREMLEELEYACEEEGNEEACAELEEMIAQFEEREGDCDKERDDDESDEENNHEDEDDESDEDDEWDEDESDDEDESNEE
jgi:hypothetical protein